jgi:predicted metal-binding protein
MKSEKMKSLVEVHICNYKRDDDECCFDRGAKDLTDKLKKWAKEETNKEVRVFRSGCLGKCSEGIAIACYPSKKMFLEVREDDDKELRKEFEAQLEEVKEQK